MIGFAAALLLAAAPAQPPETTKGVLCAHNPVRNTLTSTEVYYSAGGQKIWAIGPTALIPVDPKRLVSAQGKPFYVNNDKVILAGGTWKKYGLPRVLSARELEPLAAGLWDGVPFYSEAGVEDFEVVYALSNPLGCEFQPYEKVN